MQRLRNLIHYLKIVHEIWLICLLKILWLVVSGSIRSKLAQIVLLRDIKLNLLLKVSHRNTTLTIRRLLPQLPRSSFKINVKNTFLNGYFSKEVYMQPPLGLSHLSAMVCHPCCDFYSVKQVSHAWFVKFTSTVSCLSYSFSFYYSTIFIHLSNKGLILLLLYMDFMIITRDILNDIQELKDFLNQKFDMKNVGHLC